VAPITLFPFRYRDTRTGKWVRARYRATREEMAARYADWEITGDPEMRSDEPARMFNQASKLIPHAELMRIEEAPPDMQPAIDACERLLALLFLRRYVTWCARTRRFDRISGAAMLYRRLT